MNQPELIDILLKKWRQQQLAHFYIVDETPKDNSLPLQFIQAVYRQEKNLAPQTDVIQSLTQGHADLLFIGDWFTPKEEEEVRSGPYKVDDFQEFFKFMEFAKVEFRQKFVFIKNAQAIGGRELANKLLKTLESPGNQTTIFFEVSPGAFFLPTIESRAIRLRLPRGRQTNSNPAGETTVSEFRQWPKLQELGGPCQEYAAGQLSFIELAEKARFDNELQKVLVQELLNWTGQKPGSYRDKQQLLERIQYFQKSKVFYNSADERFLTLLGEQAYHSMP